MRYSVPALIALLALVACGPSKPKQPAGLGRDAFINAYVALRQASVKATSAADFQQRKSEILHKYGASDSTMKAFVQAHANDVGYMNEVWQEIGARVEADRNVPLPPSAGGPDRDTLIRGARPPRRDTTP